MGFSGGSLVKNLPTNVGDRARYLGGADPLEQEKATPSSILPGKSPGERSLAGYSLWGPKRVGHSD